MFSILHIFVYLGFTVAELSLADASYNPRLKASKHNRTFLGKDNSLWGKVSYVLYVVKATIKLRLLWVTPSNATTSAIAKYDSINFSLHKHHPSTTNRTHFTANVDWPTHEHLTLELSGTLPHWQETHRGFPCPLERLVMRKREVRRWDWLHAGTLFSSLFPGQRPPRWQRHVTYPVQSLAAAQACRLLRRQRAQGTLISQRTLPACSPILVRNG
mgnify:CR=1 FL=1